MNLRIAIAQLSISWLLEVGGRKVAAFSTKNRAVSNQASNGWVNEGRFLAPKASTINKYSDDQSEVAAAVSKASPSTKSVIDRSTLNKIAGPEIRNPFVVMPQQTALIHNPALVKFIPSESLKQNPTTGQKAEDDESFSSNIGESLSFYPSAVMMQGSAPYIAAHAGQTAVFHIPAEILQDEEDNAENDNLFSDIALSWLLGMKIVLVIGSKFDADTCDLDFVNNSHECHNALKVTDSESLRHLAEEAGYRRTEVERKLNRFLRLHGSVGAHIKGDASNSDEGNVVSGNFYTAREFGRINGEDFLHTGFTSDVHSEKIEQVLDRNDIVLLTTVGVSSWGEIINVNGYHLAASVAASLDAYKVIYMASQGSILKENGEHVQDLTLSFAHEITKYHSVNVYDTGFATFENAKSSLSSEAVEILLHLAWSAWALDRGVRRAHIVNPGDGAILEELFTSKNGANTCLFNDNELVDSKDPIVAEQEDWDEFFFAEQTQEQNHPNLGGGSFE